MRKSKKRIQQEKVPKKTWAEVGLIDKERNRNFDEMEWTWPQVETLVSQASANFDPIHPGEILKEFYLKPLKLTVEKASKKIGIPKKDLFAILRKKAGITSRTANKLANVFKTTSEYWINMQEHYDASVVTVNKGPQLKQGGKIPRTRKEKLIAMKMFSESEIRKRQMDEANEMLRLNPFPSNKEINRDPVAISFFRFKNEPTIGNALKIIQMIKENTVMEVLMKLKKRKELTKLGRKVFGDDKTFLKYLFSEPRALGNKMPIEFLVDDKGTQIIIDELWRIEYGIYS